MPIYEYECHACGHRLETLQKISEAPLKLCPNCGKPALHKLVSAAQFRLKGKGWYETDFKSDHRHHVLDNSDHTPSPATEKKSAGTAASKDSKPKNAKPAKAEPAAGKKVASAGGSA